MSNTLKLEGTPIAMELIPVAIQLSGIAALLVAVHGNLPFSISAILISLIWLKVSRSKMTDQYGDLRLRRALFVHIGNWLNRDNPESEFDRAQSDFLMIDGSLDDDQHRAVVTAAGAANLIRSAGSVVMHVYLAYLALSFFGNIIGA